MKIVIVDYGSGNLLSVQRGFERMGHAAVISRRPQDVMDASHLVVPGVGCFPECIKQLEIAGLMGPIYTSVKSGKPYFGICLGLQILFTEGTEFEIVPGFNWIPGRVIHFSDDSLKVPHIGWNQVHITQSTPMWEGIPEGAYFYFVHSYYGLPTDRAVIASTTEYGVTFPSAIWKDNVFACQFHPEKSQQTGLRLLHNFAQMK